MRVSSILGLIVALFVAATPAAHGQGLEAARALLPSFTSGEAGQRADVYIYYPSVDATVKLETAAAAGLFSNVEFGYLVGDLESNMTELLVGAWYGELDELTTMQTVNDLDSNKKTMKQPIQSPVATVTTELTTAGVGLTYSGINAEGIEVSFSVKFTWQQVMMAQ